MSSSPENTAFVYLYRDAENYKKWGEVVFAGPCLDEYEAVNRDACHRREVFVAGQVRLPAVFLYDEARWEVTDADHGWHELWELRSTDEEADDAWGRRIDEFVEEFREIGNDRWEVEGPV